VTIVVAFQPFLQLERTGERSTLLRIAPDFDASGSYELDLLARDSGHPQEFTSTPLQVIVRDVNRRPEMKDFAPYSLPAGETRELFVSATDPDGDSLGLFASTLPGFVAFKDFGTGLARITLTPTAADIGSHVIVFAAFDSGTPSLQTSTPCMIIVTP
jgi:hypothetical protein